MAEASAAAAVSQHRFFCHSCKGEVSPKLPEYICPRCESGFIEEVTDDSSFLDGSGSGIDDSPSTQFSELWDHLDHTMLFPDFRPFLSSSSLDQDSRDNERGHQAHADLWGPSRPPRLPMTRRYRSRGSSRPDRSPAIEGIIQQIFAGFFANSAIPGSQHPFSWSGMLHSNPGDYAWGQSGLDAIVTQLLGQLENTGPPPADKEKITSLPTVTVTQEQVVCLQTCVTHKVAVGFFSPYKLMCSLKLKLFEDALFHLPKKKKKKICFHGICFCLDLFIRTSFSLIYGD
ncbi:E3 ubiquitin-protein ligase RNF115 isoform X2 [Emys orbicularis]|uniref:E3 ubiquitin-protein ligase RNF115 isoform X2 n=1 Tax=Emys orbicularis TaxID=82168 RepID=UPI0031FDEB59